MKCGRRCRRIQSGSLYVVVVVVAQDTLGGCTGGPYEGDSFTLLSMMDTGMIAAGCLQKITQFLLIHITDKKNFGIN